jgi:hypothetical protein
MQVRFVTEVENITNLYTHWTQFLKNWYLELEMHRETTRWDELVQRFKVTFTFEHESPSIDAMLQAIRFKIFLE